MLTKNFKEQQIIESKQKSNEKDSRNTSMTKVKFNKNAENSKSKKKNSNTNFVEEEQGVIFPTLNDRGSKLGSNKDNSKVNLSKINNDTTKPSKSKIKHSLNEVRRSTNFKNGYQTLINQEDEKKIMNSDLSDTPM